MHGVSNTEFKNQKCAVQNVKFNENSDSIKVKVTFTVEQAMGARRGSTGVVLLFL
jgi:invasion protein IalB